MKIQVIIESTITKKLTKKEKKISFLQELLACLRYTDDV